MDRAKRWWWQKCEERATASRLAPLPHLYYYALLRTPRVQRVALALPFPRPSSRSLSMAAVVLSTLAMPTAWTTWTDIEALSNRKLREFILAAGLPVDGLVTKAELKVVAYEIQAKAAEEEGEGEDEGQGEGEVDWSDSWEAPLSEPFCLHAILGLTPTDAGDVASRVRASFHSRARAAYPSEYIDDVAVYALAVRRFRRLCLAFTVLKDAERRQAR